MKTEQLDNLKTVHLFIVHPVLSAMGAALIMAYSEQLFKHKKDHFYNNPANTFTYQSLHALEKVSIVEIAEALKTKKDIGVVLAKKAEIVKHRHAISHPFTVEWKHKDMQMFYDARKDLLEFKAILIWDIYKTIVDELKKCNCDVLFDDIVVKPEMATILQTILDYSLKKQTGEDIFTEAAILNSLKSFKVKFLDFVVKYK